MALHAFGADWRLDVCSGEPIFSRRRETAARERLTFALSQETALGAQLRRNDQRVNTSERDRAIRIAMPKKPLTATMRRVG